MITNKGKVMGFLGSSTKASSPTNKTNTNSKMSSTGQKQTEANSDMSHLYGSRLNQSSSQGFNRRILSPYIIFNKNCASNNNHQNSQVNEQQSANSSYYKQSYRVQKTKAGYEGQLESYVGQLDGIKTLLTSTVEIGSRKINQPSPASHLPSSLSTNMNLVGKTVHRPIFASP